MEEKMGDTEKRTKFIGPNRRRVFDSDLLRKAFVKFLTGGTQVADNISATGLFKTIVANTLRSSQSIPLRHHQMGSS